MRSKTSSTTISIRMKGTSIEPAPEDMALIDKSVKELKEECKRCGGDVFFRHDARRGYKVLEVVCQCPVELIEDRKEEGKGGG